MISAFSLALAARAKELRCTGLVRQMSDLGTRHGPETFNI